MKTAAVAERRVLLLGGRVAASAAPAGPRSARTDPRRRRPRPRLRLHPRSALRSGRRRAAPRLRAGAARSLRRARRDRAVVADPARSREPRARRGVLRRGRARHREHRSLDRARARRRGGLVLPRRRLRRPRAVAGAAQREARRGARRQAHQAALERAIALEPSLDDAYFGLGMYRYYADVAPAAAKILRFLLLLPGGRSQGRARADAARAQAAAACCRGKPTTSCTSSISGTNGRRRAP